MRANKLHVYFLTIIVFVTYSFLSYAQTSSQSLQIVGTGDGLDIMRAVASAYSKANPKTPIEIPTSIGSGGGIAAVGSGKEKAGRIARPLTKNEIESGIIARPVIKIPSAFFVHPNIHVKSLTIKQLYDIFSGKITSWSEVGGPDLRIRIIRREETDSSVLAFKTGFPEFSQIVFTDRSKLAITTQEAISSIIENPGAIGFASYSTDLSKKLNALSVDNVSPTSENYPASVVISLIYKGNKPDPSLETFISFFTKEETKTIIESFGARTIKP